jgi:hypothetical protein
VREQHAETGDRYANDVRSVGVVIVPSHEGDRRNLAQRRDDMVTADVTRMNDVIDAGEDGENFRTEKAVSIGDHADAHHAQTDAFFAHEESE